MRLCVIGAGYVGLVTAACFAEMGNQVRCVERDRERVARLRRGEMPIYEPGLESILRDQLDAARLTFTASLAEGLADAEVVFIAVGTPCGEDGSADLSHVMAVAEQLGAQLRQACIVVNKSTVPVGTAERVEEIIRLGLARRRKRFRVAVASNPEFLKEGSAVDDFRRPDRVIIGSAEAQAGETLRQLYAPFLRNHERVLLMGRREAEFSKYAANAFLATKISFMNEMAGLCALTGVDIEDVRRGMGSDKRIGTHFIYAGCGYGGSCFPKDVRALIRSAEQQGSTARYCARWKRATRGRRSCSSRPSASCSRDAGKGARWRSGGWPSSRVPTTCARRRAWSCWRRCCATGCGSGPMIRWPTPGSRHAIRKLWPAPD